MRNLGKQVLRYPRAKPSLKPITFYIGYGGTTLPYVCQTERCDRSARLPASRDGMEYSDEVSG